MLHKYSEALNQTSNVNIIINFFVSIINKNFIQKQKSIF